MLVLTRRPGEQIVIGDGIRLTVVSVGPGRVKIGIEAPPHVRIDRQEIHEKIQREQEQSSDVLTAVAQGHSDEPCPTIVTAAAGDTSTQLHNRIAERMPPQAVPADASVAGNRTPVPGTIHRIVNRLPRKPR